MYSLLIFFVSVFRPKFTWNDLYMYVCISMIYMYECVLGTDSLNSAEVPLNNKQTNKSMYVCNASAVEPASVLFNF